MSLPLTGAFGSLVAYATSKDTVDYQPMHVNFGVVPPLEDGKRRSKRDRYAAYSARALADLDDYMSTLPLTGAFGSLVAYATSKDTVDYQPMHVNFGVVPPLEDGKRRSKRDRYAAYSARALADLDDYMSTRPYLFGERGRA